jgi:cytochrome d ubiquinol oxidase subunit II
MGPLWEANHVWLIFVLVVSWTAYPVAFGSIASTLAVPLFIAALGIILRGTAYALRYSALPGRERRRFEVVLALSSILTPFALGAVVGGIASFRVPVGNARGDLMTSWLNPTSIAIGVIFVVSAAYLAAVYLAADAERIGSRTLTEAYRTRALVAGLVAGATAFGGLFVVRSDAHRIWHGLTHGWGLVALIASAAAGVATLAFVAARRYGLGRLGAAAAVGAIIFGWGAAQQPYLLRGLTIHAAAAPHSTLVALLVAIAGGALLLVPALGWLFWLFLHGRFDPSAEAPPPEEDVAVHQPHARPPNALIGAAVACFLVGTLLVNYPENGWARAIGVAALLASVACGFLFVALPSTRAQSG